MLTFGGSAICCGGGPIIVTYDMPIFFLSGLVPNILSTNLLIGDLCRWTWGWFFSYWSTLFCFTYSIAGVLDFGNPKLGSSMIVGLVSICLPATSLNALNGTSLFLSVLKRSVFAEELSVPDSPQEVLFCLAFT